MAPKSTPLPASGSHEAELKKILDDPDCETFRLLFLTEAGAASDADACEALDIDRDTWRELRALAWREGHNEFK